MKIGWCKQTFHLNPFINFLRKTGELLTVHGFAGILAQSTSNPACLSRAGKSMNKNFIGCFANLISDEDTSRKIP